MILRFVGLLVLVGFCVFSVPVSAHHSMMAYEQQKVTTLEGTVKEVKWRNPHFYLFLDVPTESGKTNTWEVEGGSVGAAIGSGITPKTLRVGAKVKVFGRRHHDPSKYMAILNGVEIDGVYHGRNAEPADRTQ